MTIWLRTLCVTAMALAASACASAPEPVAQLAPVEVKSAPLVAAAPSKQKIIYANIDQLKHAAVISSIETYRRARPTANCPCPYSVQSNGSKCGRNAYCEAGGQKPLCYPEDVSDEMLVRLSQTHQPSERPLSPASIKPGVCTSKGGASQSADAGTN